MRATEKILRLDVVARRRATLAFDARARRRAFWKLATVIAWAFAVGAICGGLAVGVML